MALIDKLRFHTILTRGGIPDPPAIEFTEALQDTFDEQVSPLATKADVERLGERLSAHFERSILALEARQSRAMLTWIGIILAAIAIATGINIAFR